MEETPLRSLLLCTLGLLCGCAATTVTDRAAAFRLPAPKLSPDSVVLEVAQLSVPLHDPQWDHSIWHELDEQALPAELRRALAANGFRVGIAGNQLPGRVYECLDQASEDCASDSLEQLEEGREKYRRIQIRKGTRSDLVMRAPMETMVSFSETGNAVSGQSLKDAQPQFALVATPRGDGGATILLTPEVHHGTPRQKFVGENGMFRIEPGRDKLVYEDLAIDIELATGQTLVVTGAGPRHSMGGNFFHEETGSKKLLLIRLAQSQYDDLFEAPPESL